jgi:phage protein U
MQNDKNIEKLKQMVNSQKTYSFVSATGKVFGFFKIAKLDITYTKFYPNSPARIKSFGLELWQAK